MVSYTDNEYWYERQDAFFKATNNCINRYVGTELNKCFNSVVEKQKDLNKVPKLPILILFVVELLFIGVLQTSHPVPIYEQLGELTICFWAIYIVILFYK